MAEEYRTQPAWPAAMLNGFAQEHDHAQGHPRRNTARSPYPQSNDTPPDHGAAVVMSMLGLAAETLTPALLAALTPVLAELDRLRSREEQAERRQAALERQCDRHSVVPCFNRRAFVRDLDAFLMAEASGTLVVLHVDGIEALTRLHGLAAGEGALRHVAAVILASLRGSDVVALLSGSAFAILLPATERAAAEAKIARILALVATPPFSWMGQAIALETTVGFHPALPGESAEQAIAAADRARRGLETGKAAASGDLTTP
ncbi:MAG: diguanylate cyclase [Magnetospirillum sp.]|nr:diguanylate cyclase [Magnetospirillum sp.]